MKKMLIMLLALSMLLAVFSVGAFAQEQPVVALTGSAIATDSAEEMVTLAASSEDVQLEVQLCKLDMRCDLALVNELRTGPDAWAYDENEQKVQYEGLKALQWDYDLEAIAIQRAVEIALAYGHTRPDGTRCFTAMEQYPYSAAGENISAGYKSVAAVQTAWEEEKEAYAKQGHRRNMLNESYNVMAAACVYYNGYYYWVQEFASVSPTKGNLVDDANLDKADPTKVNTEPANKEALQAIVSVNPEYVVKASSTILVAPDNEIELLRGDSVELPKVSLNINIVNGSSSFTWPTRLTCAVTPVSPVWNAEPSDLISINENGTMLVGQKEGAAVLRATALGLTAEEEISVHIYCSGAHAWDNGRITTEATCTSAGEKTNTCTVCGMTTTEPIPKIAHNYRKKVTKPTCTAVGSTKYTCSECKYSYTETTKALGHSYEDTEIEVTCTEAGYTTHTCSRCGNSYKDAEKAALGHSFTNYIYNEDAQICKNGTETADCDNGCGTTNTRTKAGSALPDPNEKNPFLDVPPGQYYYNPVLWAVENKITSGTSATTFEPETKCSRAQVVTFLWRAAGRPAPTTTVNPFTDVKEGQYYYKAVLWAVENKITSGTSKTTFSPNDYCTRAQVVAFQWRAAGRPEPTSTTNPFADVQAGQYYYKAVLWAVENGITKGTSKTEFSPNATCTRGQIVTFLSRQYKDK